MARRSPARFLAPLALAAAVVATIIVVQSSGSSDGSGAAISTRQETTGTSTSRKGKTTSSHEKSGRRRSPKTYTVKSGDILSEVSDRTGVSVERLQELNPDLDPQALQVGQKIKLRGKADTGTGATTTTP